jgi:hypothetical protein
MVPLDLGTLEVSNRFRVLILGMIRRFSASPMEVLQIIFWLVDAKSRFFCGTGETQSKLLV